MPIIVELTFEDGTTEEHSIPALIWRKNSGSVSKLFITEKPIASVTVDPRQQTADTNKDNNIFPREIQKSRFQVFKAKKSSGNGPSNPMRKAKEDEEKRKKEAEKKAEEEAKAAEAAASAEEAEAVESEDSEG